MQYQEKLGKLFSKFSKKYPTRLVFCELNSRDHQIDQRHGFIIKYSIVYPTHLAQMFVFWVRQTFDKAHA